MALRDSYKRFEILFFHKGYFLATFMALICFMWSAYGHSALGFKRDAEIPLDTEVDIQYSSWKTFSETVKKEEELRFYRGQSEIVTGVLALVAGLAGDAQSQRPLERGVYALFQSIGIASIGFGAYDIYVGSEDKQLLQLLNYSSGLTDKQREEILRTHNRIRRVYDKRERYVKLLTFSLLSLSQFYNASRVQNESVKNTLTFIGSINLIAAVSFSF
jgi:hypothetical protein